MQRTLEKKSLMGWNSCGTFWIALLGSIQGKFKAIYRPFTKLSFLDAALSENGILKN